MHPTPEILARLRAETRVQHAQIEKSIPVFSEGFSRDQYLQILKAFYGYISSMEIRLETFLSNVPDLNFGARLKTSSIEQDLRVLGVLDSDLRNIPRDPPLPEIRDRASALGAMYVLEGSTLGGQIITKHLEKTLGVTPETGGAYYCGYGVATRELWQQFQSILQRDLSTETEQHAAILAAQQTFASLDCWMSENIS